MKKRRVLILLTLLCIGAVVSYGNAVHGEFQFDDDTYISEGAEIRDPGRLFSGGIGKLFAGGTRALTVLSFALNYAVGGLEVEGYHIVNIVIHLLTIVAVYFFARRLLGDGDAGRGEWIALAAAGVFALHPIQTQAVTYIVQRAEALASLFYVLGLICMARFTGSGGGRAWIYWFLGMACFVLGWMSKEIIVTMPVMYALYVLFFMEKKDMRKAVTGVSPLLVLGAVLGIRVVAGFQGSADVGFDIEGLGPAEYFYTQMRVLVTYLRLLFVPVGQNLDYDYPVYREFLDAGVVLSFLFWLSVVAASLYSLRVKGRWKSHARVMGFGALWFLVVLAPTSSLVPLKDLIFEHRLYLPMLGIVMCAVAAAGMVLVHVRDKYGYLLSPKAGAVLILALWVVLGIATHERNKVWRTKLSLWQDAVSKSPDKSRPRNNLGNCYFLRGDYMSALNNYKTAIYLDPENIEAYYNVYLALDRLGYEVDSKAYLYIFQQKLKERKARAGKT